MPTTQDTLGSVVKTKRQTEKLTIEELAERLDISVRYLCRIENKGQKPSYDVLFKIIRELSIEPDLIFYPEKDLKGSEIEDIIRMLYNCDEDLLVVIKATVKAVHRLCVFASGSSRTVILNFSTFINVSFLHFGQNSGKFNKTVSIRTCTLVLFLQIGQIIHSVIERIAKKKTPFFVAIICLK